MIDDYIQTKKGIKIIALSYFIRAIALILLVFSYYIFEFPIGYVFSFVFSLIFLILAYYGISTVKKEKNLFGSNHKKSVELSQKLIFYGIIIYFFSGFVISAFLRIPIVYGFLRAIVLIPFSLAIVYLIKELADDIIQKLLWFYFISSLSINILINTVPYYITQSPDIYQLFELGYYPLLLLISTLPMILVIFSYWKTYKKINPIE